MRTIPVVAFVLSLGVATAIIGGAGIGASIFGVGEDEGVGDGAERALNDSADNASVNDNGDDGGLTGDVRGDNEPTVIGLVLSAGSAVLSIAASIVLLPVTLMRLGFPSYFAIPVGLFAEIVVGIGAFQFVTGRRWE